MEVVLRSCLAANEMFHRPKFQLHVGSSQYNSIGLAVLNCGCTRSGCWTCLFLLQVWAVVIVWELVSVHDIDIVPMGYDPYIKMLIITERIF